MQISSKPILSGIIGCVTALLSLSSAHAQFSLTLLHNNDGESKLLPLTGADAGYAGAAYFVDLVEREKAAATAAGRESIMISSGDNFLAGTTFAASLKNNTFYDALVLNKIGYDAVILGNHDFDFGPDVLSNFIAATNSSTKFLSSNLDFSAEPNLQSHFDSGKIAKSTIVTKGGQQIGIIGATTPQLPTVSSPRGVTASDVRAAVQAQADALHAAGVKHIVLASHLQGMTEEIALVPQLRHIDAVIAGGGDEFLINSNRPHPAGAVIPSNVNTTPYGPYPVTSALDADGRTVPIVTTIGEYRYLGRLELNFNANGEVTSFGPGAGALGPIPVKHSELTRNEDIQQTVIAPVEAFVAGLVANVLAPNAPALDGRRSSIRSRETNQGNLLADAILWQAQQSAAAFSLDRPVIGFTNGGGFRKDSLTAAGADFTEKDTFDIAAFPNFVSIMEDVTPAKLKSMLESAYSQTQLVNGVVTGVGGFTGRFAQIAGFTVVYDYTRQGSTLDAQGNVVSDGSRIRSIILDDGTVIFQDGLLNPLLPEGYTLDIATQDFLARGGDGYPVGGTTFSTIGASYQQALLNFVSGSTADGALGGDLSAYSNPAGENRITPVPEPASAALLSLGALLLARRPSRRRA